MMALLMLFGVPTMGNVLTKANVKKLFAVTILLKAEEVNVSIVVIYIYTDRKLSLMFRNFNHYKNIYESAIKTKKSY
jgi:hypothetical protein